MIGVFSISIITTVGGVGGGGLLIPLYTLSGSFNINTAIPLTIITILGDTLVRIFYLYNKPHPLCEKRDIIYFYPLLIITLFDANTSFFGVILSGYTPDIITISSLIFVLLITFYKSIHKAIDTFIKEKEYINNPNNNYTLVVIDGIGEYFKTSEIKRKLVIGEHVEMQLIRQDDDSVIFDNIEVTIHNEENYPDNLIEKYGDKQIDKYYCTALMGFNIGVLSIFSITRKYFNVCTYPYWLHAFGQFITTCGLGYLTIQYIISDYNKKRNNRFIFIKGDIVWNKEVIKKFTFIGSITGFISTYIGIGGGMLITPIMISTGMIPEVVVATSSISTLFSCIISTINYYTSQDIPLMYGLLFACSSALGSYIGIHTSDFILQKYQKQSIIIFIVSLIVFTSIILLTTNAINNNMFDNNSFKDICIE
tara:strand:+ start:386 stop:1654 length:1269 start_codon:yes stop_codon:yes gene_type:complete